MQMQNIARLKLLKIDTSYCTHMEDGKEHKDKLIHSIRPWKGYLRFSRKILRGRESTGEQKNKIRRAF